MTAQIVSLVSIAAALFLAWRALRARRLKSSDMVRMGLLWLAIIVALTIAIAAVGLYPRDFLAH